MRFPGAPNGGALYFFNSVLAQEKLDDATHHEDEDGGQQDGDPEFGKGDHGTSTGGVTMGPPVV